MESLSQSSLRGQVERRRGGEGCQCGPLLRQVFDLFLMGDVDREATAVAEAIAFCIGARMDGDMLDRSVFRHQPSLAAHEAIAVLELGENIGDGIRIRVVTRDGRADVFASRVSQKVEFGLVGPGDSSVGVDPMHRHVGILGEVDELLAAPFERLLQSSAGLGCRNSLGHVAGDGIDGSLLGHASGVPLQPDVMAVGMAIPVQKLDRRLTAGQPADFGGRLLAVVGVNEVHELSRLQLVGRVAEQPREILVDPAEVAVEARDPEQVEREVEESHQFLLGPPLARLQIVCQLGHDRGGAVGPRRRIGGQTTLRKPDERERCIRRIEPRECFGDVARHGFGPIGFGVGGREGRAAGEHLAEDAAKPEDIGPSVDTVDLPSRLLRSQIGRRAADRSGRGEVNDRLTSGPGRHPWHLAVEPRITFVFRLPENLRHTPVHHRHDAKISHHDVGRLEIAMDHPSPVRGGDRLAYLQEDSQQARQVGRAVLTVGQDVLEGLAGE